jgi:starch synthase (maltosyl-transferring)
MKQTSDHFVPRIYYFHPLLAGEPSSWRRHLNRCKDMGFDHVLLAPIFAPGEDGDIFLTADHDRAHPAVSSATADAIVEGFAKSCRACGLSLFLDIVVGEVARDALLARSSPSWFRCISAFRQRWRHR